MAVKRRRNRPEETFQRALCQYLDLALPPDAFYFAIPNGGWRTKAEAGILKATGVKAGVPDLCILYNGMAHFVELKSKKGTLSDPQLTTGAAIICSGSAFAVWRTLEDAERVLTHWGVPLRAEVRP
jgi:hypothetical protein